jgi:hypothetical protein
MVTWAEAAEARMRKRIRGKVLFIIVVFGINARQT